MGGMDTKLFHGLVIQNQQREKLMRIKKENGKYVDTREDMEIELV